MKKIQNVLFATAVMVTLFFSTFAHAEGAGPIKIEYVSFVEKNHLSMQTFTKNWEEIEKRSQGRIKFVYRGGPEAIDIFGQADAVSKGVADMVFTSPSNMGKIMVKGTAMLTLCQLPVSEHRKNGLYDYLNTEFNKVNLQFLQMYPRRMNEAFYILSKKKIERLDDLKGMKGRGATANDWFAAAVQKFGVSTVPIKFNEEPTALRTGVVDFSRMTLDSLLELKAYESAKYLLEPAWASAPNSWFMNLDKWNAIPADLQKLILDTLYELAPQTATETDKKLDAMKQELLAKGVQICTMDPESQKAFYGEMEKSMHDSFSKDAPDVAKKIYDLTRKK